MRHHPLRSGLVAGALLFIAGSYAHAQYPRTVLIEEFTSITCGPCVAATAIINDLLASQNGERFAVIRNQEKTPKPVNPYANADSKARADYYVPDGIGLPHAALDGDQTTRPNVQEFKIRAEDRLLVESPLQMTVAQTTTGNQVSGTVQISTGEDGLPTGGNEQYKLYIVAVERIVDDPSILQIEGNNGETRLYDVMRSMTNGQNGVDFTINPNGTATIPFSYNVDPSWHADQMYTVAFVQEDFSQAIVQSGFSPRPQSGVKGGVAAQGFSLAVAPQPARDRATVSFSLDVPARATLTLRDVSGTAVRTLESEVLQAGRRSIELDLAGLPAGVYTCTVAAGERRGVQQVVVVR